MPSKSSTPIRAGTLPDGGSRCSKATATGRCRATPRSAGRAFSAARTESAAGAASSIGSPAGPSARAANGSRHRPAAIASRVAANDQSLRVVVWVVFTLSLQ